MSKRIISENIIEKFKIHLCNEEKSNATIEKYVRDVHAFKTFLQGSEVSKENVVLYKKQLISQSYTARSINSMLASLNSFFRFLNWDDIIIKQSKNVNDTVFYVMGVFGNHIVNIFVFKKLC